MHRNGCVLVGVRRLQLGPLREFALHLLTNGEKLARQCRCRRFRKRLSGDDMMRECDGVDLVVGSRRFCTEGARRNFSGLIGLVFLRDGVPGIEAEERRFAVLRRRRDSIGGDLAVERSDRKKGVDLFFFCLKRFGKAVGAELRNLDALGLYAGLRENDVQ